MENERILQDCWAKEEQIREFKLGILRVEDRKLRKETEKFGYPENLHLLKYMAGLRQWHDNYL